MIEQIELQNKDGTIEVAKVAGLGARAYAFAIDWHIRILIAVIIAYLGIFYMLEQRIYDRPTQLLIFSPAILFYFLYHPVIELLMRGDSPGKRYAKVRVVTLAGESLKTKAVLLRNLFRIVDSLPFFYLTGMYICLRTDEQHRLGDRIAGTLLVYDSDKSDSEQHESHAKATIEQLIHRWPELDSQHRVNLARKLIQKLGEEPKQTEDELLIQLTEIREQTT